MRTSTALALPGFAAIALVAAEPARAQFAMALASATTASSGWVAPGGSVTFTAELTPRVSLANSKAGYTLLERDTGAVIESQYAPITLNPGQTETISRTFTLPADLPAGRYQALLEVLDDGPQGLAPVWSETRSACIVVRAGDTPASGIPTRGCADLPAGFIGISGNQFVDETLNPVRISAAHWYGTENVAGNPSSGLWNTDYKTIIDTIKGAGFNTIRIPWNDAGLNARPTTYFWSGGSVPLSHYDDQGNVINTDLLDPSVTQPDAEGRYVYKTTIEIFRAYVAYAGSLGMKVIFDHHNNEGTTGGTQANGLWFDLDAANGMHSDYGSNPPAAHAGNGRTTYEAFKANTVQLATAFAGDPTVIGYELHNEPIANPYPQQVPVTMSWGRSDGPYDIKAMAEDVGNAILAVSPRSLIFVEGPLSAGLVDASTGFDPSISVPDGNLTPVGGFAGSPPAPVVLSLPRRVAYVAHNYPREVTGQVSFGPGYGAAMMRNWNDGWSYVFSQNLAPILISETGAFLQSRDYPHNAGTTSADGAAWRAAIVPYLNGEAGAWRGPSVSANQQPISTGWFGAGNGPGDCCAQPNGTQSDWGPGNYIPDVLDVTDRYLYRGNDDISAHGTTVYEGGGALVDGNRQVWAILDGRVMHDGVGDDSTDGSVMLAYLDGTVWRREAAGQWWSAAANGWAARANPLAPSAPGTVATGGMPALIDEAGNAWSLGNGRVLVNGVLDRDTRDVLFLVRLADGIWQKTGEGRWLTKSSPEAAWVEAPAPTLPVSPDGSLIVEGGAAIVDANGSVWSIAGGVLMRDGRPDPAASDTMEFAYLSGTLFKKTVSWEWSATPMPPPGAANVSWSPAGRPALAASPDGTVLRPRGGSLVDDGGTDWSISGGRVTVNGFVDATSADVVRLARVGGRIWRENGAGEWWSKAQPLESWLPGASPL